MPLADLVTSMQELVELTVAFVSVADSIDLTTTEASPEK